ncbi:MAG: HDIG domain-containing protein [Candidatus Blackburnbacteria bacterium]|nr:HDIG domain-containing protein [Candidatus Blackburnbacteria bacterium]
MIREEALKILHDNMQFVNLRRHCYAVEAVMRALAGRLGGDMAKWGVVGLLHDGDYEKTKDTAGEHTLLMHEWLKNAGETDEEILNAILSHNYSVTGKRAPGSRMEWALYCCDELTGFIVAVALVRPDRKLASVTVESIMKKWDQLAFAAAVDRKQIEMCEEKLGIPLQEFVGIALGAMQGIANDLGL